MPQPTKAETQKPETLTLSNKILHDAERDVQAQEAIISDLCDEMQAAARDLARAMQRRDWAKAMHTMAPDQPTGEASDAGDILQEGMDEAKQNGKAAE